VPAGESLIGPNTSPGAPGEVRLCATSFEVAGIDGVSVPLAMGLSDSLGRLGAAGRADKCPPAVAPTVTFFSPLGNLDPGEFSRDDYASHPPLLSWQAPSLVGNGSEETTPGFVPLSSAATTLANAAPTSA
jgi:hypothetical protein